MLACGWLRETVYFLPSRQRILLVFFMVIPFVSLYKTADSVRQQIRDCPYKTQTAITGTRPPLVASQYRVMVYLTSIKVMRQRVAQCNYLTVNHITFQWLIIGLSVIRPEKKERH